MFSIIWWIFSVALRSIWWASNVKALKLKKISSSIFKLFCYPPIIFALIFLVAYEWIDYQYITSFKYLWLILLVTLLWVTYTFSWYAVLRVTKMSDLLPYQNLDKLFTIIVWFILFYWTENWTSFLTLLFSLITVFVTVLFSIDIKNLKIPKSILLFFFTHFVKSLYVLLIWYILIELSTITFTVVLIAYELLAYSLIAKIKKDNFWELVRQDKWFYKLRFIWVLFCFSAWLMWLYIIKDSWVVVATLLWFFAVVFDILATKFILKDNPSKKQILLAILVILLIWVWYYFK